MKVKFNFFFIIFFLSFLIRSNAQENIDTLLIIAAQNNPGLKAKFNKYLADLQKIPQVGSLPDPNISFGYFIKPMELVSGNQVGQIQLMQMFPWFGTLKAAKNEASTMALSSFELFRAEKEEIFYNVRTTYYRLFLTQKQLKVYDTTYILLKSIEQLLLTKLGIITTGSTNPVNTESQFSKSSNVQGSNNMGMNSNKKSSTQQGMNNTSMSGNGSAFSDLLRLQVEIKELEDNIAYLNNRKQNLIIQINSLLNRKPYIDILIPDSLSVPDFDFHNPALFDSIKANNPMIKMNKADVLAYQQKQRMNKKMSYPMIGLGLNYMLINKKEMSTSNMNGEDMIMPMLTLNIPIYRKKYNASIKEAQYLENSSKELLANVENMLFMEFSEDRFALKDAERKLDIYHTIIALIQNSFNVLIIQYSSSGADFDALVRLHRQLLDYKLNISQAQVDKLTAIAGLQKLLSKN
jgi:outer membrane protein TolC